LGKVERHHLAAILARSRALIKRLSTVFVRLPLRRAWGARFQAWPEEH